MKLSELNIIDFRKSGNTVTFGTDQSVRIVVTFISDKTAKLFVDFSGNSEPDRSYAIETLPAVLSDVDITETDDSFVVSSKELSVRLGKHNIRIDYLRNSAVLSSENEICRNDDGSLYCAHNMAASEHFYGLGEDNDAYLGSMDRRGTTRDMITGQRINIGHVTADIPVTFFMSTGESAPYGIFVDNSYRMSFWASACVYYANGSESAHSWFLENADSYMDSLKAGANGHNVGNMGIYGYYTYLLCENRNEEVVSEIAEQFEGWKRSVLDRYKANPWNIAINEWSFWWGSFNIILGNAQELYIGCSLLGLDKSAAEKVSQDAVNFITGVNAVRKCFITGMGEDPIKCTFSNIYYGDSSDGVPSGYMPGGVNSYNGGIISRFPLKCYYDSANDWFTNENAIYWNAVMVFNSALAVSK